MMQEAFKGAKGWNSWSMLEDNVCSAAANNVVVDSWEQSW